ncbi:MAG: glycosyl hydrolase family 18 protein [Muribaculaceae bacterium]|nr:glycosyl hydrolase family 18 protein [Muribaculaceae bacterium]
MKLKNIALLLGVTLAISSCSKDDYERGVWLPAENPAEENMEEYQNGKVSLAYVTYYGTLIPDTKYITHINYAFAQPKMGAGGVYNGFALQGDESRFKKIVDLKDKNPQLKILLSFNTDGANGGFSALAKSADARKAFAEDCKAFIQKWGIDGIDMDWEFPGLSWSGNKDAFDTKVDVANHVLLMKQLRETLGTRYLLTYAGYINNMKPTSDGGMRYIDIAAVDQYVDFVNIMTYDIAGAPRHQSALDSPAELSDCNRAVKEYLNAGIKAEKLVLGIPFYARAHFESGGAIDYKNVLKLKASEGYKIDNWDAIGSVPYITKNGVFYAGYDNTESIAIKGKWAMTKGMKGFMFWDYDGDDAQGTLRNACWNAVMKKY